MFGPEERRRAVDLYSATPMTTARVVRHLGYPARQCLERWLAKDSRYAGHMAKPIIPLETRTKAIEPVPDGSERSATGSRRIARAVWPRCGPKNRNAGQTSKPAMRRDRDAGDAEALRRRIEEPELGNAVMREVVEARRKRPGRRPAAPVEQGEDDAGRPAEAEVFAEVDGLLAAHSAEQLPLPPCQDRR